MFGRQQWNIFFNSQIGYPCRKHLLINIYLKELHIYLNVEYRGPHLYNPNQTPPSKQFSQNSSKKIDSLHYSFVITALFTVLRSGNNVRLIWLNYHDTNILIYLHGLSCNQEYEYRESNLKFVNIQFVYPKIRIVFL